MTKLRAGSIQEVPVTIQFRMSSPVLTKNFKIKIYKTIILLVLYGCETRYLTKMIDCGCFEKREPRRIFGSKREEVTGDWRRLHNEKLRNLYPSPNIIRMMKSKRMLLVGHVARMCIMYVCVREREIAEMHTKCWSVNVKGKDHFEELGIDGRVIIRMVLREAGLQGVYWIHLAHDGVQWRAVVNMAMNLRFP
jgi:hypothetical protein